MTLRTFARRTGWPLAELLQLRWTECNELLALFGLRLQVTPLPHRSGARRSPPKLRTLGGGWLLCEDCWRWLTPRSRQHNCVAFTLGKRNIVRHRTDRG